MDYKKINEKLKNLDNFRYESKPVFTNEPNSVGEEETIYNWEEVYDIGLEDGMFVKLNIQTNSYGYDESIVGLEFVQAQEKKVTVYEYKG